jgi:UDP-GlcNAc:undecaprenyl-phosphate GlcNAc-1-phosphate transferase
MLEIPTFLIILAAGVISFISMPLVIKAAYKLGAVDKPEARKSASTHHARLGGLAMYLSFMICIILFIGVQGPFTGCCWGQYRVCGWYDDDIFQLSPWVKTAGTMCRRSSSHVFWVVVEFLTNPFDGMLNLGFLVCR